MQTKQNRQGDGSFVLTDSKGRPSAIGPVRAAAERQAPLFWNTLTRRPETVLEIGRAHV